MRVKSTFCRSFIITGCKALSACMIFAVFNLHFLPELLQSAFHGRRRAYFPAAPFPREHAAAGRLREAIVEKYNRSVIFFRSYNPSGCLQYLIHSRADIRIPESLFVLWVRRAFVIIIFQDFLPGTHLGQSGSNDDGADQSVLFQVNSFTENTAHHTEPDQAFRGSLREAVQEIFPVFFISEISSQQYAYYHQDNKYAYSEQWQLSLIARQFTVGLSCLTVHGIDKIPALIVEGHHPYRHQRIFP